jgi:drug/metabolite transporter (DMT)-like permease
VQLLIAASFYGSLTVAARLLYSLDGPPSPSMFSFVRGIIAALCFVPVLLRGAAPGGAENEVKKPGFWWAALELAWWNLGAQGLQNAGLLFTEASRASFLTQTSVVLTPVLSLFFGEKVGG